MLYEAYWRRHVMRDMCVLLLEQTKSWLWHSTPVFLVRRSKQLWYHVNFELSHRISQLRFPQFSRHIALNSSVQIFQFWLVFHKESFETERMTLENRELKTAARREVRESSLFFQQLSFCYVRIYRNFAKHWRHQTHSEGYETSHQGGDARSPRLCHQ